MPAYPEEVDVTVQDGEDGNDDGTPGDDAVGTFNTRRNGTYRIGYNYADDEAVVEVVSPSVAEIPAVPDDPDTDEDEAMDAIPAVEGTDVMVFWAKTGTTIESDHDGDNTAELLDVLVADVASRAIVVDESDPQGNRNIDGELQGERTQSDGVLLRRGGHLRGRRRWRHV